MAEGKIRIPKDKVKLIKELCDSESDKRIFSSMADCMTFAAAYGYSKNKRISFQEVASDPIRYHIFEGNNYDTFFHLLAMYIESDAHVLGDSDEMFQRRAKIFEEFANGGLDLLQSELQSSSDTMEPLFAIISKQINRNNRGQSSGDDSVFDIDDLEI